MGDLLQPFEARVLALADALRTRHWRMATAESCTGGFIAAACTSVAGSSDWFERGFVVYSNLAKAQALGVSKGLIEAHGAVSEEVALDMARGALAHSQADLAVAVTGIAGPGGGSVQKPVGLVWLALATSTRCEAERLLLSGDRAAVRQATVDIALQRLIDWASA